MSDQKILYEVEKTGKCFDDMDEAIEYYLDGIWKIEPDLYLTVCEMAPMLPMLGPCNSPLEYMIECLDEEYSDPEGDYSVPTPAMREAERVFIQAVLKEYKSWLCEPTGVKHTVRAYDWIKENAPQWLDHMEEDEA